MGKVIFQMIVSLDGYYEGPGKEIDWHVVDEKFNEYSIDMLNNTEVLVYGRATYQIMQAFWPLPEAVKNFPQVAGLMNGLPKVVFSKTLQKTDWQNTRLAKGTLEEEIVKLKKESVKNIMIGGSDLAISISELGLIDEYRIIVAPIVLSSGKPIFHGIKERLPLKLIQSTTFSSGNMLLCYEPVK